MPIGARNPSPPAQLELATGLPDLFNLDPDLFSLDPDRFGLDPHPFSLDPDPLNLDPDPFSLDHDLIILEPDPFKYNSGSAQKLEFGTYLIWKFVEKKKVSLH